MGISYRSDRPVAAMLLQALPYTLAIAASAMLLTLLISLPLGIAIAAYRNSALDCIVRFLTFIGNAVPSFIVGILLMFLFSYQLGWIPVLAGNSPIGMVLPTAALALISGLSGIVFGYHKGHVVSVNLYDAVNNKKALDPEYLHLAKVLF